MASNFRYQSMNLSQRMPFGDPNRRPAQVPAATESGLLIQEIQILKRMVTEKEHLLDVQNEQMKQMQANLVSTIKRSSSVNNEVIEYNRKLQQELSQCREQLTLTQHYYGQRLAARSTIDKDNQDKLASLTQQLLEVVQEKLLLEQECSCLKASAPRREVSESGGTAEDVSCNFISTELEMSSRSTVTTDDIKPVKVTRTPKVTRTTKAMRTRSSAGVISQSEWNTSEELKLPASHQEETSCRSRRSTRRKTAHLSYKEASLHGKLRQGDPGTFTTVSKVSSAAMDTPDKENRNPALKPRVLPTVKEEIIDLTTPEPRTSKSVNQPLKQESLLPTYVKRQKGTTVQSQSQTTPSKAVSTAPSKARSVRVASKLEAVVPSPEEKSRREVIEMKPGAEVRVGSMTLRRRRGTLASSYKEPSLRSKLRREQ